MAGRKNTLPDALALAMLNHGVFHFCQPHVRRQLWDHYDYSSVDHLLATGEQIVLTESGKALLAQSPLWAAHQRLVALGYRRDFGLNSIRPRKASKRYIPYKKWNEETEREDTAWISASGRTPDIWIGGRIRDGGSYRLEAV